MQSGSDNPLWYSTNLGPAHMVYLSNYADFSVGSPQYDWLVSDLARCASHAESASRVQPAHACPPGA